MGVDVMVLTVLEHDLQNSDIIVHKLKKLETYVIRSLRVCSNYG